ncbi:hypothetical protein PGTUg99_030845 [Puccinia graminis f. sp. tritici]|uniref:Uncharacterized protein n=1 Tax=Puccinia graminis f. sp. tritici TaxID=56615 RepID=A0A5B0S0E4_PUCGR|nr:hypothetical protein PGTUg99_022164 [Puccinia graminis f. sp. tritici]KAA1131317.1 hypothetical protein PGTUg99_031362 [Puccinia graminis f. sp. tritici]KAA1133677.1 hypothetical protein PGTUg99_030845 [Puccinia graminis f. sp. tritici]
MTSSRPMSIASTDATITGTCSDSDSIDERSSFDYDSSNICSPVDYDSVDKRSSAHPADYSNFSPAFTRDTFSLEEIHDLRILITDELIRFARSSRAANETDRIQRLRLYSRVEDLFSTLYMHQLGPPMELRRALIQAKGEEEKKKDKEEMIVFHKEVAYLLANSEPSSSSRV